MHLSATTGQGKMQCPHLNYVSGGTPHMGAHPPSCHQTVSTCVMGSTDDKLLTDPRGSAQHSPLLDTAYWNCHSSSLAFDSLVPEQLHTYGS